MLSVGHRSEMTSKPTEILHFRPISAVGNALFSCSEDDREEDEDKGGAEQKDEEEDREKGDNDEEMEG